MKKYLFIICLTALVFPQLSFTQGQVNSYLKVLEVLYDQVKVDGTGDLASFKSGDKVLLIQMTGAEKGDTSERDFGGNFSKIKNCGTFEILQVDSVVTGANNYVVFTDSIFFSYTNGEKIQLVRILEEEKVVVNGKITAKEWDGSTGGIVAIIGLDTIELKADIDVSGSGFRGGQAVNINPNACRTILNDTVNWYEYEAGQAGHKGEGILAVSYGFTRGTADALNGGGSGYGKYSGGGGGSNYRGGGKGGMQSNECPKITHFAQGGFNQFGYGKIFNLTSSRRIIMGGGGGAGTQNTAMSKDATPGGDGGGIIILITETLVGSGGALLANGQDVLGIASASAGGGGAGGTILVDAASYSGTFPVEVKGGDGGNTGDNCTGAGGSGSGGVLWYSGPVMFPGATVNADYSYGTKGETNYSTCLVTDQWGQEGALGGYEDSLLIYLNGFLFNTVRGLDTICSGQTPGKLTGSNPKGGDGNYMFLWLQSTNKSDWDTAYGIVNKKDYLPPSLTQTTYYRRRVRSSGIEDMSKTIEIYVYDAISGNTITGTDTICRADNAKPLTGAVPPGLAGGNNTNFVYQWQSSTNGTIWNTITGATLANYDPDTLTSTRYYRRYVTSAEICTNTSDYIIIKVLPYISSNEFYSDDTTICQTLSPGFLNAKKPGGGDMSYRFDWLMKTASTAWQKISGANDTLYNPGLLNETTSYRRIVYSGNGNACKDTSHIKLVTVLDSISNNRINIDPSLYCAGVIPSEINGQLPGGGDAGNYVYQWQEKTSGNWSNIAGAIDEDYTPSMVEDTIQFRRLVSSGLLKVAGKYACHDTSSDLLLKVIPYIINRLDLTDQTLCQYNTPLPLSPVQSVSGGNGSYDYQWKQNGPPSTAWDDAPGASTSPTYAPNSLETTTLFIRVVKSDICVQPSDTVTVTVYPLISNNIINGGPIQYTCYNTSKAMNGSTPLNGKPGDYAYLWQQSTTGSSWQNATGKTPYKQIHFESSDLTDSMLYRRIVYSSAELHECSDISDSVTVRINSLPSGDVISFAEKVCGYDTLYVTFNVSADHGPLEVTVGDSYKTWTKSGITDIFDSIPVDFENNQEIREIQMISIEDDSACWADTSGYSNKVTVNVYKVPDANAGLGGEVCGDTLSLAAVDPSPYAGEWSVPGGSFDDPTSPATLVTMSTDFYGKNYMKWTVTNTEWPCIDWDTAGVMFYEQPMEIYPGDDTTLLFIYTYVLEATEPRVGTGHWKVVEGTGIISNDTLYNATIKELSAKNLIRWTIINGKCPEIKDSVEIIVKMLEINKGFSPNDDGTNDEFIIPTENADRIALKIYDRTGVLVFESDDYTEEELWKGKGRNNVELPEGTYFYVMDIWVKGKTEPVNFKSFVEILR